MSGIDGIGKRGPAVPSGQAGEAPAAHAKDAVRPFREVAKAEASTAATPVGGGASPLDKLRAGHVDVNGYLDLKVDEATASLTGLPPSELDAIRRALREQLAADPHLSDLVAKATGSAAPPTEE